MKRICTVLVILIAVIAFSKSARAQSLPAKAFKNVTVHKSDGSTIEDAVIVWRDGLIESVGKNEEIPFDAEVWDGGDSLHVYPGFIDGNSYWGSPDRKHFGQTPDHRGDPSYKRAGIRPEREAHEAVKMNSDDFKKALKAGFTTAALATKGYMMPGQLDLFFLQPELQIDDLYEGGIGMQLQFQRSSRVYPTTVMGIMAQLEQLILDAQAYKQRQEYHEAHPNKIAPPNNKPTLEALYPVMQNKQRVFFKVDSKEMIKRVFSLQDKLGFEVVIVSGMEGYEVAEELKQRNIPVLASINFPEKPEWKKDEDDKKDKEEKKKVNEEEITEEMKKFREKRWEAYQKRYKNIKNLLEAGVKVGFASADLKLKKMSDRLDDWKEYGGLETADMLKVMTVNTAQILNKAGTLGEIDPGYIASFSVMTKPFLEDKTKVIYSVSEGKLHEFND